MRYNKIVIATDADGCDAYLRMLLTSYFLLFYPEQISQGYLYISDALFRVRTKKETRYYIARRSYVAAIECVFTVR